MWIVFPAFPYISAMTFLSLGDRQVIFEMNIAFIHVERLPVKVHGKTNPFPLRGDQREQSFMSKGCAFTADVSRNNIVTLTILGP